MLSFRKLFGWAPAADAPPGARAADYLSLCREYRFKADRFFELLLEDARHFRATDLHIVPEKGSVAVRLRVDGALRNFLSLDPKQAKFLIGRIKVLAEMDSLNYWAPQDGSGSLELAGSEIAFRASTIPVEGDTVARERAILRIFSRRDFDVAALGLEPATLLNWRRLLDEPQGMLVVTGPANSGKTTTIYSSLLDIQKRSRGTRNIATVEDPVEFPVPGLSQSQVNPADNFGFPQALRAMLRQDPQIIMIGEIRDPETARIAVEASLTGHLIVTTVHAKQVTGVFPRMQTLGITDAQSASAVLAILNQRLVPLNCPDCVQPCSPTARLLNYVPPEKLASAQFMRGTGCERCGRTGFLGRTTVAELLVSNPALREAVCAGTPAQELYRLARIGGMRGLWECALELVLSGACPLEEAVQGIGTA